MLTDWLHTLYEYWYERDTPYSSYFDFWTEWLLRYFNKLTFSEAIESDYLMCKSEQHILTPKYHIMRSFVTLVRQYFVTMEEDDNQLKITCQRCNDFLTYPGRSG